MSSVKSKLLSVLPNQIVDPHQPEHKQIDDFIRDNVDKKASHDIDDIYKKTLVLEAQKSRRKKVRKPRPSKKKLTAREKRDLGLYRLPKKGLAFANFTEMAEMWRNYMRKLLDLEGLKKENWKAGSMEDPDWKSDCLEDPKRHALQMKICRADFHGAVLKVEKAECPSQVGREGICLMETKHTFQIISADNTLRIIPKKGSVFSITLDGLKLTFPGTSMLTRPAERATKKPKTKLPLDF